MQTSFGLTERHATTPICSSVPNFAHISLKSDMVFRDGVASELATVTGNAADGYTAVLPVGINV